MLCVQHWLPFYAAIRNQSIRRTLTGAKGLKPATSKPSLQIYRACPELSSRRVLHERLCGLLPASPGARNYANLEPRGPWPKTVLSAVAFLANSAINVTH